jgi:small-conductance mechanosensitive channel
LHFFSREFLRIEFVKSDLRFKIMEMLREKGVEIPFPQRDLWFRNPEAFSTDAGKQPAED